MRYLRRARPLGLHKKHLRQRAGPELCRSHQWQHDVELGAWGLCLPGGHRATSVRAGLGGAQTFQYDAAGNMTVGLEGRTIAYDGSNRPSAVTWRGASTRQSYRPGPSGCAKPPPAASRSPQATPSGRRRRGGSSTPTPMCGGWTG